MKYIFIVEGNDAIRPFEKIINEQVILARDSFEVIMTARIENESLHTERYQEIHVRAPKPTISKVEVDAIRKFVSSQANNPFRQAAEEYLAGFRTASPDNIQNNFERL